MLALIALTCIGCLLVPWTILVWPNVSKTDED